jgi:hypothetical protein
MLSKKVTVPSDMPDIRIRICCSFLWFVLCGFTNRGVALRIKIHHSDPSTERSFKIVRQLENALEPYRMVFKELKGKKEAADFAMLVQRK